MACSEISVSKRTSLRSVAGGREAARQVSPDFARSQEYEPRTAWSAGGQALVKVKRVDLPKDGPSELNFGRAERPVAAVSVQADLSERIGGQSAWRRDKMDGIRSTYRERRLHGDVEERRECLTSAGTAE